MAAKAKASKPASQIQAVIGTDDSEVKRVATELAARMTPDGADEFGVETIDGGAENVDGAVVKIHQTADALETLPFFGDKLVWLKSATFLADNVVGRSNSVHEALERLTEVLQRGLPPNIRFLLSAVDVDKRRAFYKTLGKVAEVQVFDALDTSKSGWEAEASQITEGIAARLDIRLEPEALEFLVVLTGGDTRQVTTELEKLSLYTGGRRAVTVDDVRLLVPQSKSGVVFDLGRMISRRDAHGALQLLDQLLRQGETAVGILLASIIPTVRNLLLARDLMDRHRIQRPSAPFPFVNAVNRLPESATRHLPRKKDGTVNAFGLGFAAMDAHRFTSVELRAALEACLEANLQVVTSQLDTRVVLSRLIIRILAKPAAAA